MNTYVLRGMSWLCLALCSLAASAQPPVPAAGPGPGSYDLAGSRWVTKEKARALEALLPMSADVLVVPFQVEGDSFDVVERSLMTRTVATGLRVRAGLSVAPPTLVEQAFGSSARTISEADVLDLARRLHVKTVVRGFVGHDNRSTYHVRVESFAIGAAGPASARVVLDARNVAFGDTNPPYFTFRAKRDELVDAIAGPAGVSKRATVQKSTGSMPVPSSVDELVELGSSGGLQSAYLLQFLAVLHPAKIFDRARDGLFERSLLALEGLPESAQTRAVRARAWGYLNRRPVALATLKHEGDEELALKAYLDGDLERLSVAVAQIRSPLAQLIATLELERLRTDYGRASDKEFDERLAKQYPYWAAVLLQKLSSMNGWSGNSNVAIKLALDAYWPIAKYDLRAALKAGAALDELPTEGEISRLAFQHLEEVAAANGASATDEAPRAVDLIQMLRVSLVANISAQIAHLSRVIGRPQDAMTLASAYEPMLADEPSFSIARGWAEFRASDGLPEPDKIALVATSYEHLRRGAMYSQGQTDDDEMVLTIHHQFFPGSEAIPVADAARMFFDSDWPNRPGWGWQAATEDADRERRLRQCIDYTIEELQCLRELHAIFSHRGKEIAASLVEANESRFIGNPQRIEFLASAQREVGDNQAADSILREAIAAKTRDWEPYRRLGTDLAKQAKPQAAAEVFLKYPGFKDPAVADRVTLSNYAYEVGSLLYWAGAYVEARPLYEFAAAAETGGSDASVSSRIRLDLLDGNFPAAMEHIVQRARRYRSQYAVRDVMMFSGALGDRDTAWAVFNSLEQQLRDQPEFWIGAFALHRMEGASIQTISEWASHDDAHSKARTSFDSLAMRHIFLTQTVDRNVPDSLAPLLRERDPGPPIIRDQWGAPTVNGTPLQVTDYFDDRAPPNSQPQPEQKLDSRLTMAALGLAALGRKDYERAFSIFEEASRTYWLREFLPYYTWASAQVGKTERVERYLAKALKVYERDNPLAYESVGAFFDQYLSLAVLEGFKGNTDLAVGYLAKANADVIHTVDRAVPTRYEIAEVAELLLDRTHDKRYREFLAEFARHNAVVDPVFSWPYAFLAKYSNDAGERKRALARALFLDPQSKRALQCDPKEIAEARRAIRSENPFIGQASTL